MVSLSGWETLLRLSLHISSITCQVMGEDFMKLVTVLLPEAYLVGLDELVRSGMYPSRSAAIRAAVRDMLKRELWAKRE